jgi:hypothetical protein
MAARTNVMTRTSAHDATGHQIPSSWRTSGGKRHRIDFIWKRFIRLDPCLVKSRREQTRGSSLYLHIVSIAAVYKRQSFCSRVCAKDPVLGPMNLCGYVYEVFYGTVAYGYT